MPPARPAPCRRGARGPRGRGALRPPTPVVGHDRRRRDGNERARQRRRQLPAADVGRDEQHAVAPVERGQHVLSSRDLGCLEQLVGPGERPEEVGRTSRLVHDLATDECPHVVVLGRETERMREVLGEHAPLPRPERPLHRAAADRHPVGQSCGKSRTTRARSGDRAPENARSERASGERRLGARLAVRREAERREARPDASRLHLFGSSEVSCSDTRSW